MERIVVGLEADPASEVFIANGWVGDPDLELLLPRRPGRRRLGIIAQPGEPERLARSIAAAADAVGLTAEVREIPDREEAKTLVEVEESYRFLQRVGLGRADTVVGIGGGAATDVAGFVAATYLRGIEAVYVPTTLLGAVDAAIGGKTGVNLDGKNLVGAFHHPRVVVIDPAQLSSLDRALLEEGFAEAVKTGMIGDPALVRLFDEFGPVAPIEDVVARSVRVKAAVVGRDDRERGERAILNYGHTVGHAVETAAAISHGHAVSIGMVAAAEASRLQLGFAGSERQRRILISLGLPIAAPSVDRGRIDELMDRDKKKGAAEVRMTLLEDIARPVVQAVDPATVEAALGAVGIA